MKVAHGTVVAGKVVLDDSSLPEGAKVYVLSGESGQQVSLSADELAELEAGLAEADWTCPVSVDGLALGFQARMCPAAGLSTAPPPARKRPEASGAVDNPCWPDDRCIATPWA